MYAGYGIYLIQNKLKKPVFFVLMFFISISYLYYPILLTKQFTRYTPKSNAYLWMKENSSEQSTKLVYTEEGLDPMNKLPYANVKKVEVYPNQNAQLYYPVDPKYFDYIIISSRPLEYYKKPIIQKNFPLYSAGWMEFENSLQNTNQYELIKEYVLSKPNLIPLSDVFIYKNLSPLKIPAGSRY
ncbi:hypothetical protein A2V49_01380 [candidate division WWE3 bacterium RBG_19FT_COMBO_34_6]|uniref:Uncharacterized protein n=1 Tax=candidate division WWE3 bacterium RBG_19FT_COMBO_34_6 TaxID=1802612 RepID=A0A1F4UJZ3_UNCKA|nr:MAG: hypothetical protein A2V49_01380 [candidate division WWE3 bacterium RBG_19FT_COMBO_34_6]